MLVLKRPVLHEKTRLTRRKVRSHCCDIKSLTRFLLSRLFSLLVHEEVKRTNRSNGAENNFGHAYISSILWQQLTVYWDVQLAFRCLYKGHGTFQPPPPPKPTTTHPQISHNWAVISSSECSQTLGRRKWGSFHAVLKENAGSIGSIDPYLFSPWILRSSLKIVISLCSPGIA